MTGAGSTILIRHARPDRRLAELFAANLGAAGFEISYDLRRPAAASLILDLVTSSSLDGRRARAAHLPGRPVLRVYCDQRAAEAVLPDDRYTPTCVLIPAAAGPTEWKRLCSDILTLIVINHLLLSDTHVEITSDGSHVSHLSPTNTRPEHTSVGFDVGRLLSTDTHAEQAPDGFNVCRLASTNTYTKSLSDIFNNLPKFQRGEEEVFIKHENLSQFVLSRDLSSIVDINLNYARPATTNAKDMLNADAETKFLDPSDIRGLYIRAIAATHGGSDAGPKDQDGSTDDQAPSISADRKALDGAGHGDNPSSRRRSDDDPASRSGRLGGAGHGGPNRARGMSIPFPLQPLNIPRASRRDPA